MAPHIHTNKWTGHQTYEILQILQKGDKKKFQSLIACNNREQQKQYLKRGGGGFIIMQYTFMMFIRRTVAVDYVEYFVYQL